MGNPVRHISQFEIDFKVVSQHFGFTKLEAAFAKNEALNGRDPADAQHTYRRIASSLGYGEVCPKCGHAK